MKYSVAQIVRLADVFDTRVKSLISDRCWALAVLAQDVTVPTSNLIDQTNFGHEIKRIAKITPTSEEWDNWYKNSKPTIDRFLPLNWYLYSVDSSSAELDFDHKNNTTVNGFLSIQSLPLPGDYKLKEKLLIPGTGSIPNLFVQVGLFSNKNDPSFVLPRDIAHDNWFFSAINSLFSAGYSERVINSVRDFLEANKNTIKKIRSSFAISEPKYLGGGADGVAFDIGEGKVLKIFRDEASFQKAKAATERLHTNPSLAKTEAMIYDVGILGIFNTGYGNRVLYYYIIEQMKLLRDFSDDLPDLVRTILRNTVDHLLNSKDSKWKRIKEKINDPTHSVSIKKEVEAGAKQIAHALKRDVKYEIDEVEKDIPNLNPNWLESYVEEIIMKYLTGRTDLHMGNLGVTNYGQLRYFDPAYGNHNSEINGP